MVNEPPVTTHELLQVLFVTVMVDEGGNGFIDNILESVALAHGELPIAVNLNVTDPLLLSFVPGV